MKIGAGILLAYLALSQEPKVNPQQKAAAALWDLGDCHARLAPLEKQQARVEAGVLIEIESVKQRLEAANPDLVLNLQTFKLSPKPKAEKSEK